MVTTDKISPSRSRRMMLKQRFCTSRRASARKAEKEMAIESISLRPCVCRVVVGGLAWSSFLADSLCPLESKESRRDIHTLYLLCIQVYLGYSSAAKARQDSNAGQQIITMVRAKRQYNTMFTLLLLSVSSPSSSDRRLFSPSNVH